MANAVCTDLLVRIFDKVCQQGLQCGESFRLNGIESYSDSQGTCMFIEDSNVQAILNIKGKCRIYYCSDKHLHVFKRRLQAIDEQC